MTSVQQILLGLVLAGTAFVFGSYLHREQPISDAVPVNSLQADSDSQGYVWQENLPQPRVNDTADSGFVALNKDSQPSMPSLQPGARSVVHPFSTEPQLVEANLVPNLSNQGNPENDFVSPDISASQQAIAEPDFSRYAIEDYMEPAQAVSPPIPTEPMQSELRGKLATASEIATPDFGQHFPSEIRVNNNEIPPSNQTRQEESLFRLRRPNMNTQQSSTVLRPARQLESQFTSPPKFRPPGRNYSQHQQRASQQEKYYERQRSTYEADHSGSGSDSRYNSVPERAQEFTLEPGFRPIVRKQPTGNSLQNQGTHSNTVSIRPRNRSPIMSDSTRYKTYQTTAGETLHDLAVRFYGDSAFYLDIYVVNQGVLNSPGEVPAGITLKIPVYE